MSTIAINTTAPVVPTWRQTRAFARACKKLDLFESQACLVEAFSATAEERHLTAADEVLATWKTVENADEQRLAVAKRLAQGEALAAAGIDVKAALDEWFANRNRKWATARKVERFIVAARLDEVVPNAAIESEPVAPVVEADDSLDEKVEAMRALGFSDTAIAAAMFAQG